MPNHVAPADQEHARQAWKMGRRRRQQDDHADALAVGLATAEQDRRTRCLQRWAGIVAAIRTLIAAYNDGSGSELLTVSEHSSDDDPAVTIASQGHGGRSVTVAVDGDALLVRTNQVRASAVGLLGTTRRIDCSRSDMGTAAYLLQPWMDQLT